MVKTDFEVFEYGHDLSSDSDTDEVGSHSNQLPLEKPPLPMHAVFKGQIKLAVYMNFGLLTVHVIQSRHLSSKWKSLCDSYVKMSLLPDESKRTRCKTQVVYDSNNPLYDEKFSFELLEEDHNKRLLISVWHRDQTSSLSEFLGCMSFGVRHLLNPKKETTGWYYLLTEEIGRKKHLQVSKKKQQQQLKVRPHNNIPAINKDIWWMDPMTITVLRGKNGFGFSVIESCPVRIGRVDKASPAEEAGLKKGDCIVRVNGRNVSRSTADSVVKLVKHSSGKLVLDVQRSQEVCIEKMDKSPWRPSSSMQNLNDENKQPVPVYNDDLSEFDGSDNESRERQLSVDEDIILAEADFPTSTPLPLFCNAAKTVPSADRRKQEAIHRLMSIELDFIDFMHSGIERYSRPLRHCILNAKQHLELFQNVEKLVTISEYHIKQMQDNAPSCSDTDTTSSQSSMDGTNHFVNSIGMIYQSKIQLLCQAYDIYARGLSNANKVLSDLKRCQEFQKFIQDADDGRQPSIMAFIYRAAQHIRELYQVLRDVFENTRPDSRDFYKLKRVVEGLRECVTNITNYSCTRTCSWGSISSGISSDSARSLGSSGSSSTGSESYMGKPKAPSPSLASYRSCDSEVMKLQDRLIFPSNVEMFQLCGEDRHLIYSSELYEWDGRAWAKIHAFLFTDILLLTERDRRGYYIVLQNPIFLRDVRGIHSQREHKTEFVMHVNSPRDPFSNCRVSFAEKHLFRSPSSEQKFTWKSLIEQRIFAVRGSVEHFSSTSSINNCGSTVIV
ncbi:uncharacterized protein LOC135480446 [Liolophura sinensis]|uniref:uncharacterized protein LOC135480446 n=1 Tax=Liolophura sinensis TaxID=3198878 RepID=UPI003157FCA7